MKKKGIALVTSIMILLMLSLLAAGMMFTIKNESAISMYQASSVRSVQVAEAALDEVKHRMNLLPSDSRFIGDTTNPLDPDWKTVVLFASTMPSDSDSSIIFTPSLQITDAGISPSDPELDYTTQNYDSSTSLTIRHKTTASGDSIYFFDSKTQKQFAGPPSLVVEYPPVEIVEITARSGKAVKKIVAEISKQEVTIEVYSALSATNMAWNTGGTAGAFICGHNHKLSTTYKIVGAYNPANPPFPTNPFTHPCWRETNVSGVLMPNYHIETAYDSINHPGYNHKYYNKITSTWNLNRLEFDRFCSEVGCVAGYASKSLSKGAYGATKSRLFGNPDLLIKYDITIPELWQILGYNSLAEMNSSISWIENSYSTDTSAVRYHKIDNPSMYKLPILGAQVYSRGIIWFSDASQVVQILPSNGGVYHKGLIYVEGDCNLNAGGGTIDIWILGAMLVKGNFTGSFTGTPYICVLYCKEALTDVIEADLRYFKLLGWKELN